MSIWDTYGTDKSLETEGVWVELRGGAKVKVRSLKTVQADRIRSEMFRKKRLMIAGADTIPPEVIEETNLALLKRWVIADWSGFTDLDTGESIPCTPDNIEWVMRQLRSLREDVLDLAGADATFRTEPVEETAKNSPSTSAPASGGADQPPSSPSKPPTED